MICSRNNSDIFYSPDIALIKFSPPIIPGATLNSICLPSFNPASFAGLTVEAIGYGFISPTGPLADNLKEVKWHL